MAYGEADNTRRRDDRSTGEGRPIHGGRGSAPAFDDRGRPAPPPPPPPFDSDTRAESSRRGSSGQAEPYRGSYAGTMGTQSSSPPGRTTSDIQQGRFASGEGSRPGSYGDPVGSGGPGPGDRRQSYGRGGNDHPAREASPVYSSHGAGSGGPPLRGGVTGYNDPGRGQGYGGGHYGGPARGRGHGVAHDFGRGRGRGGLASRIPPRGFEPLTPVRPAERAKQMPSQDFEPIARQDYGTLGSGDGRGRAVRLVTNTFDLRISENVTTWFKYEVIIRTNQRPRADGSVPEPRGSPPKSILRAVWAKIEADEQAGASSHFHGVQPAFDGRTAAYTNVVIPTGNSGADPVVIDKIAAPDRPGMTFSVILRNPISIPLASIRSYMMGGRDASFQIGDLTEALQALNVVMAHKPACLFYSTRTSFFVSKEAADKLGARDVVKESVVVSFKYLELWRGFFQSVRAASPGLNLNINTTSTGFYCQGDLDAFIEGYFVAKNGRFDRRSLRVGSLNASDLIRLNRILQKITVVARRGPTAPALSFKIRGRGIVDVAPRNHLFETDNGRISVEAYLRDNFTIQLVNPDWPLVEVKPGVLYPLELIHVVEGNKYAKRLTSAQQQQASAFQTLLPAAKLSAILTVRQRIIANVSEPFLTVFGLELDPDPKETLGRILEPPLIEYRKRGQEDTFERVAPQDAKWQMQAAGPVFNQMFYKRGHFSSLVVIMESPRNTDQAPSFFNDLFSKLKALGMDLSALTRFPPGAVIVRDHRRSVADNIVQAMDTSRREYRGCNPDLVVWVFEQANSPDYALFKYECVRRGLASQALQSRRVTGRCSTQIAVNIGMKLNAKTAGYSFSLVKGTMGGWFEKMRPMLWGADLSHEPDQPSVAVFVASMHDAGIVYEETARVQGLVEPATSSSSVRAKKQEVILDAKDMFEFLLRRFVMLRQKVPPKAHLVFRDGVSESEFSQVQAFRDACNAIKRDPNMQSILGNEALQEWQPTATFIATLKRHHVRAFLPAGEYATGSRQQTAVTNLLPGTVFDRDVTSPYYADHYGAAHKALIGTTRPTRYVVLADEQTPRMTGDEVQATCHALCFAYQRCNAAVSVPAPVYYADLIAGRIRGWLLGREDDGTESTSGTARTASETTRRNDLVGAQQLLADTEQGRDAFRGCRDAGKMPSMWWM